MLGCPIGKVTDIRGWRACGSVFWGPSAISPPAWSIYRYNIILMPVSTRKSGRLKALPVVKAERPRKGLRGRARTKHIVDNGDSLSDSAPVLRLRIPNKLITPPPALNAECPVCGSIVAGDLKDVEEHVEHCLEAHDDEEEEQPAGRFEVADELPTAVLNVEGEESRYGRPQYTFADVQHIIAMADTTATPTTPRARDQPLSGMHSWTRTQLLQHITRLHAEEPDSARCVVCLDGFRKPVVSVGCWHVCCEACWCGTLGAKRLCPQCNRITSPDDLRRIYL